MILSRCYYLVSKNQFNFRQMSYVEKGRKPAENKTPSTTATAYPPENRKRKPLTGASTWQGSSQLPTCQMPYSPSKMAKMQCQSLQLETLPTIQGCQFLLQDALQYRQAASNRVSPSHRFPLKNRSVRATSTAHLLYFLEAHAQQLKTNTRRLVKV